jgi:integrase
MARTWEGIAVPQRKKAGRTGKQADRIRKVAALHARPGTAGERQAAATVLARIGPGAKALAQAKASGLTDAIVKRLPVPEQGNRIVYDAALPGFGIRVTAADSRSFVLNYWTRGRERRYTIGGFPNWRTAAARQKARELKRLIDDGGDPLAEIEAEREAPTVADLCDRFEQEHLPRKRPGTAADYKRILANHIRPHFGKHVKVADVTFDDIARLHGKITKAGHSYRANAAVRVANKMFSLAIRWNMRSDNPCRGIERNYESKRKRYLSGEELSRLTAALTKHRDKQTANVFRLLLLTGARRGEVLGMRWADIDFGTKLWTKAASTTKQNADHQVPLSAPTLQLLSEIRAAQSSKKKPLGEYVFPGNGDAEHIVNVKRAWRTICKAAKIGGLRVHDLRHSFASQLASSGASLPLIGALLGHSNPTTTHRYAHLFDDPQRAAVERVGAVITAAGQPATEPTPLKRRTKRRA